VTAILPVEKKSAAEEPENEATLIELARFPGYTPSRPTPLPHSLDTLEQMRRVTRAQAKLAAKREGYREYWRENFYSIASQTIFLDTFWWFFLERYQVNNKHLPLGHYVMITSFYLCEAPQGSAEFAVLSSRRKLRHFSRKLRDSHLERQIPKGISRCSGTVCLHCLHPRLPCLVEQF
jgi:hypothetical protein